MPEPTPSSFAKFLPIIQHVFHCTREAECVTLWRVFVTLLYYTSHHSNASSQGQKFCLFYPPQHLEYIPTLSRFSANIC